MRILDDNCFYSKDIEVKIFEDNAYDDLVAHINEWLWNSDVEIISIKYSTFCNNKVVRYSAMIVFKF